MKTVKTNSKDLMVVEVPEDAYDFKIEVDFLFYRDNKTSIWNEGTPINIPDGKYKILNKLSEVSEEECKRFVESYIEEVGWSFRPETIIPTITLYCNYKIKKPIPIAMLCNTAKESLISLLQSNRVDCSNLSKILLIEKL